jgi:hypothetical protein
MATKITRKHWNTELKKSSPLQKKVEIFAERVQGWQIEVAQEIKKQIINADGEGVMGHAAYGLIAVFFSYFEMLGQFLAGKTSDITVRGFSTMSPSDAFAEGFKYVYPSTKLVGSEIKLIYSRIRCGLYHDGFTKKKVLIDGTYKFGFDVSDGKVRMNPHIVVNDVAASFKKYVKELQSTGDLSKPKRIAFKKLFDFNYFS